MNRSFFILMPLMCILCVACSIFGFEGYTRPQPKLQFTNSGEESVYILPWNIIADEYLSPNVFYNQLPQLSKVERESTIEIEEITYHGHLSKGNSVHILVFKQSTLDRYSDEEIIRDNIYDARYVLTEDDLVDNTFTIVYTGESDSDILSLPRGVVAAGGVEF